MTRFVMLATVIAVFGILLATATASAQTQRDEVMLVIPMEYMNAAIAAEIFGGQVVQPAVPGGQSNIGNRGYASGSYQSGASIGGGYNQSNRGQSAFGQNNAYRR